MSNNYVKSALLHKKKEWILCTHLPPAPVLDAMLTLLQLFWIVRFLVSFLGGGERKGHCSRLSASGAHL